MSIVIKEIFSFRHSHIMLLFSRLVISNSLQPHWLQHARLLCPSPFPRVCSNLGPLSWWCHLTISSSVILFSSHLLSSLAWGSFLMSWLCIRWPKYWSFSISPSSEYSGLISLRIDQFDLLTVQGTLESSWPPQLKNISSLTLSLLYDPPLTAIPLI